MSASSKDVIISGGEHTSAFGARCSQVFDAFNPRFRDIAAKGVRGWWLTPPRTGIQRLIAPWEYRHLRLYGGIGIAGGSVGTAAGLICLSYSAYGWAAFFLAVAALRLAAASWFLTIAFSAPAQAEPIQAPAGPTTPVLADLPADGRAGTPPATACSTTS
jgi:hypothetical protein